MPTTQLEIKVETEGTGHTVECTYSKKRGGVHVECTVSTAPSTAGSGKGDDVTTRKVSHDVEREDSTSCCFPCACIKSKKRVTHVTYEKSGKNRHNESSACKVQEHSLTSKTATEQILFVNELKTVVEKRHQVTAHSQKNPLCAKVSNPESSVHNMERSAAPPPYAKLESQQPSASMENGSHYEHDNGYKSPSTHIFAPVVSSSMVPSQHLARSN